MFIYIVFIYIIFISVSG